MDGIHHKGTMNYTFAEHSPSWLFASLKHPQYSLDELVNTLTHAIGLLLSVGGLSLLVTLSSIHGTAWHVVSSSIYGASLVLLFTASSCYHAAPDSDLKSRRRVAEQALIFVLIAGTYTPFTLAVLRGVEDGASSAWFGDWQSAASF